ncbi:MAG: pentapeptide repeat-containing protein [Candidatus Methanoperedens sp.]
MTVQLPLNEKLCQVKMASGEPCGRLISTNEKCIFHFSWTYQEYEEHKIFDEEFWKEVDRIEKNDTIKELDFSNFIFPNTISFEQHIFKKPVLFVNAKFDKKVQFLESNFNDIADFTGAEFCDEVNLLNAQFNKNAIFVSVRFRKKAIFIDVKFDQEANFDGAEFDDEASFYGTKFDEESDFNEAKFNKKADFITAEFNKAASFTDVQFCSKAFFNEVKFNNDVFFSGTEFMEEVSFRDTVFENKLQKIIFRFCRFHKPSDVKFQDVNLSNVSFLYTDITKVEFLNEKWAKKNGRLIVVDESIREGWITYDAIAQLYRRLRWNYEANYKFAEAGDFFIGEMEMRRRNVITRFRNENIRNIELWIKENFSLLGIFKHLSLYGESYIRPLIFAFIIIISYPLLMHWLFNASSVIQPDDFLYVDLRKSAASFFQMDSTYIVERIIGIPILGLSFIALKRKFERKR